MTIQTVLKDLRLKKELTQQYMADQLCMSRSAFSKLEAGSTVMPYPTLLRMAQILQVSIFTIIAQVEPEPTESIIDSVEFKSIHDKLSWMLYLTYQSLCETNFSVVPFEDLEPFHYTYLLPHGYTTRDAYESTPRGGRLYDYGPKEAFQQMFQQFGMAVLFQENMIRDEYWLAQWQRYSTASYPEVEIDETDYFTVHVILLTMPDGGERMVQVAERDFADVASDEEMLAAVVMKVGAQEGEFLAVSFEGYDPVTEIIK